MTIRNFLNSAAQYLTDYKGVSYSVKCFNYPVQKVGVGTYSDYPVEYHELELEGVICITRDDYDVKNIFQGYLCYPEKYPEFYKSRDFILCFGPEKNLNFDEILESEIDFNSFEIFGLVDSQISKIRKKYRAH